MPPGLFTRLLLLPDLNRKKASFRWKTPPMRRKTSLMRWKTSLIGWETSLMRWETSLMGWETSHMRFETFFFTKWYAASPSSWKRWGAELFISPVFTIYITENCCCFCKTLFSFCGVISLSCLFKTAFHSYFIFILNRQPIGCPASLK